jgi:hypothetical protein
MRKRSECLGGNECTVCHPKPIKAPGRASKVAIVIGVLVGVGVTTWLVWRGLGHLAGLGVGVTSSAWLSSYMDRWV